MNSNQEVIRRLSRYRNVMRKMKALGLIKVFSDNLADAVGVSPSLVRKDFSMFNLTGNKRGGYRIDDLVSKLNVLLGKDKKQKIIIVGCGKLGQALMNHNGFPRVGIRVVAGFDSDPEVLNSEAPIPILHIKKIREFIEENQIRVATLTVPEPAAQGMVDTLKKTCVKGVINFSPVSLKSSEDFLVHNMNIEQEIENLFYNIHFAETTVVKVQ
ncbi:redox-sensing transcriptional repressor Rex [Pontiella sulfatireligans]|uniref:Redox-sensing transcriptional repressor Rex n=1 Tax=Pontiella sulfatireligans TaxID=2750658 RepID=A0A6C2UHJ1_9BACT|nr:redox-sensing transcriptional repressor Rex [Pontiella sulfatireligans]VGO18881.1 Redox-sensing transcriptional repressor Rex [Pontiella sulfatireligans]